jgi:hypothetical protein
MNSSDSVVMGAFVLAGVFLISHGYLSAVWNSIYNNTHGSNLANASTSTASSAQISAMTAAQRAAYKTYLQTTGQQVPAGL